MSGFGQTFQGDWEKLQKQLQKIGRLNYQKMHQKMGEALVANTQMRFTDQVDPDGQKWKATRRGGQILTQTNHLGSSITYNATAKGVEVGTNLKYAAIHQFGGKIKAKKAKFLKFKTPRGWVQKKEIVIPARPFIGFSKEDQEDIGVLFRKAIEEVAKV